MMTTHEQRAEFERTKALYRKSIARIDKIRDRPYYNLTAIVSEKGKAREKVVNTIYAEPVDPSSPCCYYREPYSYRLIQFRGRYFYLPHTVSDPDQSGFCRGFVNEH